MNQRLNKIVDRIDVFQAAWLENAPDSVFAGMTLAEFKEEVKAPGNLRSEILSLVQQAKRKRVDSEKAISTAGDVLNLVVNSVRGTPAFGPDCALYHALGYVLRSERKTGLVRRPKEAPPEPEESPSTDAE